MDLFSSRFNQLEKGVKATGEQLKSVETHFENTRDDLVKTFDTLVSSYDKMFDSLDFLSDFDLELIADKVVETVQNTVEDELEEKVTSLVE